MSLRRLQAALTRAAAAAASGGGGSGSARGLARRQTLARGQQRLCHGGGGGSSSSGSSGSSGVVEEKAKTGGKAAKEEASSASVSASASTASVEEEKEESGAAADETEGENPGQQRLTGLDLLKWSNQREMFMPGLHKGALQAYAATAWLCAQSDEELGAGSRWTRLPIDDAARRQLEKYDGATDPFNNASMLMKVADPEDRVTGMFLKEVVLEESGEVFARVMFQVDANPTALYGEDYEMAKSMATTLLRPQHEEMAKTLGLRLLNVAYSAHESKETMSVHPNIGWWSAYRKYSQKIEEEKREGTFSVESHALALPWATLWKWFLMRYRMHEQKKEWLFRKDTTGKWHLNEILVFSAPMPPMKHFSHSEV